MDRDNGSVCVEMKLKIPKCIAGIIELGVETCLICNGGVPIEDGKKCLAFKGETFKNCELGVKRESFQSCFKCVNEYMYDEAINRCVPQSSYDSGCMIFNSNAFVSECVLCNYIDGFYTIDEEKCRASCLKK